MYSEIYCSYVSSCSSKFLHFLVELDLDVLGLEEDPWSAYIGSVCRREGEHKQLPPPFCPVNNSKWLQNFAKVTIMKISQPFRFASLKRYILKFWSCKFHEVCFGGKSVIIIIFYNRAVIIIELKLNDSDCDKIHAGV